MPALRAIIVGAILPAVLCLPGQTSWARPALGGMSVTAQNGVRLQYQLPYELKELGCYGDNDGDCLDDDMEDLLAWIVAPMVFHSDLEECPDREDFFQVTPLTPPNPDGTVTPVEDWTYGDPASPVRFVKIVYFFNYSLDCGIPKKIELSSLPFGIKLTVPLTKNSGRHLGDSEGVEVLLSTVGAGLDSWMIRNVTFYAHNTSYDRDGAWLASKAADLDVSNPFFTVATSADKHASYPGEDPDSSRCGFEPPVRGLLGFFGSFIWHGDIERAAQVLFEDCFAGTWQQQYDSASGLPWVQIANPIGSSNIGEAPFEQLNSCVGVPNAASPLFLSSSTEELSRVRFTQYGTGGTEFLFGGGVPGAKFCGHTCVGGRTSDGCAVNSSFYIAQNTTLSFGEGCATRFLGKVEHIGPVAWKKASTCAAISSQPSPISTTSCVARGCNFIEGATCQCDPACSATGDCCTDVAEACGTYNYSSCADHCGGRTAPVGTIGCACDYDCGARGDCCVDVTTACPDLNAVAAPVGSCVDLCGLEATDCRCDHGCEVRGDCCSDKKQECGLAISRVPGSCASICGQQGLGCDCSPDCLANGDCCVDYSEECQSPGDPGYAPGAHIDFGLAPHAYFCFHNPDECRTYDALVP